MIIRNWVGAFLLVSQASILTSKPALADLRSELESRFGRGVLQYSTQFQRLLEHTKPGDQRDPYAQAPLELRWAEYEAVLNRLAPFEGTEFGLELERRLGSMRARYSRVVASTQGRVDHFKLIADLSGEELRFSATERRLRERPTPLLESLGSVSEPLVSFSDPYSETRIEFADVQRSSDAELAQVSLLLLEPYFVYIGPEAAMLPYLENEPVSRALEGWLGRVVFTRTKAGAAILEALTGSGAPSSVSQYDWALGALVGANPSEKISAERAEFIRSALGAIVQDYEAQAGGVQAGNREALLVRIAEKTLVSGAPAGLPDVKIRCKELKTVEAPSRLEF